MQRNGFKGRNFRTVCYFKLFGLFKWHWMACVSMPCFPAARVVLDAGDTQNKPLSILLCLHLADGHQSFPITVKILLKLKLLAIPTSILTKRKGAPCSGKSSILAFWIFISWKGLVAWCVFHWLLIFLAVRAAQGVLLFSYLQPNRGPWSWCLCEL